MSSTPDRPLLHRLLVEGELCAKARSALLEALDDPGTVEWRGAGNTLQIDVYKANGRVERIDLLDGPEAPAELISAEELKEALQNAR